MQPTILDPGATASASELNAHLIRRGRRKVATVDSAWQRFQRGESRVVEMHVPRLAIFGIADSYGTIARVDCLPGKAMDFAAAHAGINCDENERAQIGLLFASGEQRVDLAKLACAAGRLFERT